MIIGLICFLMYQIKDVGSTVTHTGLDVGSSMKAAKHTQQAGTLTCLK